ncbi:MAG: proteasome subunit beta [Candidatus Poribacteria bacterium]|nr:proteasome subunit beta [Candidatus Poribacteria bacterium]
MLDLSDYGTSDFFQILKRRHPELLATLNSSDVVSSGQVTEASFRPYEGTTVLAVVYNAGVVMAGDRQATEGYQVGERRIQKIYPVDRHSAIAVAGAAGPCIEMAKLFQVEVEFYEKTEGVSLSLEGQANFLSHLVRSNLGLAMQGLIVLPLFAGYDLKQQRGRIFKYDAIGGRYEENDYYAIGSGGKDARTTLKKRYTPEINRQDALAIVAEAIWDAADEDIATGGPDLIRKIFPTLYTVTEEGVVEVPETTVEELYRELISRL